MLRVAITTLGCKVNQYDTATIEDRLRTEGHSLVPFTETADVYVVNSCTVTNQAGAEVLKGTATVFQAEPKGLTGPGRLAK